MVASNPDYHSRLADLRRYNFWNRVRTLRLAPVTSRRLFDNRVNNPKSFFHLLLIRSRRLLETRPLYFLFLNWNKKIKEYTCSLIFKPGIQTRLSLKSPFFLWPKPSPSLYLSLWSSIFPITLSMFHGSNGSLFINHFLKSWFQRILLNDFIHGDSISVSGVQWTPLFPRQRNTVSSGTKGTGRGEITYILITIPPSLPCSCRLRREREERGR